MNGKERFMRDWDEWWRRATGGQVFGGYKNEVLWICDRCESTLLGTKSDVSVAKWKSYAGGKLILCPDCQPVKR